MLPTDLLMYLTKYLSYTDITALMCTTRALHNIYSSPHFWKNKLREEYPQYYARVINHFSTSVVRRVDIIDDYRLIYKYLALLPTFIIEDDYDERVIGPFDIKDRCQWLANMQYLAFIYPIPVSTCLPPLTDSLCYVMAPDILIRQKRNVVILFFNKREVLPSHSELKKDLPLVVPDEYVLDAIRVELASYKNMGLEETMIFDEAHLPILLQRIKEAGYYSAHHARPGIYISQRDVRAHRDLFDARERKIVHPPRGGYKTPARISTFTPPIVRLTAPVWRRPLAIITFTFIGIFLLSLSIV